MSIPYFFAAAAGGFVLMATVGIQVLVTLLSSIPLTRRHRAENPEFNAGRAFRRIALVSVLTAALVGVITALVLYFCPISVVFGYLLGMILALVCSLKRMSPNNEQNRRTYEEAYADCYPPADVPPAAQSAPAPQDSKKP
jgi:hypothetical protein